MRRVLQEAHATALAGVGDQEAVLALVAAGSGEAVSKDAEFQIAAEASLDMGRRCFTVLAVGELQPGFEVRLHEDSPLNPWDSSTFYGGREKGCIDYPALT